MTYNPNDMIAYMPAIAPPLWLTAVILGATAAFFYFFKGTSITFWLARSPRGQALLARNNYALGSQITPAILNHIIPIGEYQGQSVARILADCPVGQSLLEYNNCALGKLIINRRERAPGFSLPDDIQPYFQDPKLLRQFLQSMPDRRNDIITEASEHVARLRSISRAATTCSALRSKHLNQRADYNPLDDLDSWEQHTIIGLCSLFRKKPDSNMLTCSTAVPTLN